jgi:hypothetical protein
MATIIYQDRLGTNKRKTAKNRNETVSVGVTAMSASYFARRFKATPSTAGLNERDALVVRRGHAGRVRRSEDSGDGESSDDEGSKKKGAGAAAAAAAAP